MSIVHRKINVTFALGQGTFGESGFDVVTLTGLRCQVDIAKAGGISKGALHLRMWGLTLDQMMQLSKVGRLATSTQLNTVSVDVGDDAGMSNVFQGSIYQAWPDFAALPDVAFDVQAAAGWFEAIKPVPPTSYKGPVDVAVIMSDLAQQMNLGFENNGVSAILTNPYLPGTAWDQVTAAAQAADINFTIDSGVLAIWPRAGKRQAVPPVISPDTGLIGYPQFNATGITLRTLFNPAIRQGATVQVQSELKPACGEWRVNTIAYNLSSEQPNGPWFQTLDCSLLDRMVLK